MVLGAMGDYLRNQHAMGRRRKIFACDLPSAVSYNDRLWNMAIWEASLSGKKAAGHLDCMGPG